MKKVESELHSIKLKLFPIYVLENKIFLFKSRIAIDLPESYKTISYLNFIYYLFYLPFGSKLKFEIS